MSAARVLPALVGAVLLAPAVNAGAGGSDAGDPATVIAVLEQARRVLWVGAHPDDENAAGALLARAADVSGGLVMATLTRGENSHRTWAGLCRGSAIGRARAALFADAAATFGAIAHVVGPVVNGPHPLRWLDARCPPGAPFRGWPPTADAQAVLAKWRREGDPVRWVTALIRHWRPDVVVAMDGHCGVTGNPEHIAVARVLDQAMRAAEERALWSGLGPPWTVAHLVEVARVSRAMRACGRCRCQGAPPPGRVYRVPTLERSPRRGVTWFRIACRAARHYENVMEVRGWSARDIERHCAGIERRLRARRPAADTPAAFEPYRLRTRTPAAASKGPSADQSPC